MVLFRGLKNTEANKNSQFSDSYPIKLAVDLLASKDSQGFIQLIKSLIRSSRRFSSFYFPVIEKFAEFVQNLPENQREFFGQQVRFLTQGLERASRTLSLCLAHFFPEEANFSNVSKRDALWIYATFTAALFLDVGKIAVKYTVTLYREKDHFVKQWDPYTGTMLGQGSYYKFDYIKENLHDLYRFITPILARQILDSATGPSSGGFNWIASDPEVLAIWFALLVGEEDRIPMTSFMSVIPRAEIEIVENYRKEKKIVVTDPAGDAFLQWLRKEITEGRILINKQNELRVTEKEIILSVALFQQFADSNASYKHPEIIEKQFIDIAKLYQISISELDQRYRAHGGLSGISDLGKRYRTIGGLAATQENEQILPIHRCLKGGVGLLSLITSQPLREILSLSTAEKTIIKSSSPNPTI
jgi:hypothetical protein